jgi:DHA1 family tetracycline resistance protein-like MFS transporter
MAHAPRTTRSPLFPIFLIVLVDVFGLTLVLPLLAPYAERFGATPLDATLLVSVYAACQLVAGPLLGRISDRTGRKPMLLVSQVGTLLGFALMANAWTLWVIFAARVLDGLTAGNLSLAQAYISDKTAPEDRSKSFALIGIAFGVGFFFGPFISGYLAKHVGYTAPIWLAAGMSAASILCTATLLPGGPPTPHPQAAPAGPGGQRLSVFEFRIYAQYFRRPLLATRLLQFFCFCVCFTTFTSGFALFAERTFRWHGVPFGPGEVGYVFAYAGFLGILLQGGLIGRLVKRFGDPSLVTAGFIAVAIGYGILGLSHGLPLLLVATTFSSFGTGTLRPVLTSLITKAADRSEQGVVLGLTQSLNSTAAIVAPIAGGFLIGQGWLAAWAEVAAAAGLAGLLVGLMKPGRASAAPIRT